MIAFGIKHKHELEICTDIEDMIFIHWKGSISYYYILDHVTGPVTAYHDQNCDHHQLNIDLLPVHCFEPMPCYKY